MNVDDGYVLSECALNFYKTNDMLWVSKYQQLKTRGRAALLEQIEWLGRHAKH